ncbi:YagK/YfjJ domain-containing protein [Amphritea balenae]|uniref:Inovirus Gp2 family protein n=1 Tax=Amphritea balenae TaxID=452629 RepID=A0A3P1SVU5_9GAMM|nr:inovirus-type Gp2 protein [Amphritea balenae]RRD01327.1 inovirus Gp2 family protein [Amphritea balenae]GGK58109.1 hypothetical protein GCM10007941_05280 [Amphritea balenae]
MGEVVTLCGDKDGQGHYVEILDCIAGQLNAMLSYHSKLLVTQTCLRLTADGYTGDNKPISRFMAVLNKKLKSKKLGFKRVGYIWCRELVSSAVQHYHLTLMLDGHKCQMPHYINKLIEQIWLKQGHTKPWVPKNPFVRVLRGDKVSFLEAYRRTTYLAKVFSKGYRDKAANDYSASRYKLKSA